MPKLSLFRIALIALICLSAILFASPNFFYSTVDKKINNKKSLQNNFTIKINSSSLSILGGDLDTKFFELIYSHPSFYLFSSPSGVLLNLSRDSDQRNVTLWQNIRKEQLFYGSTCNK